MLISPLPPTVPFQFIRAGRGTTLAFFYVNFNRNFCSIDSLDMFPSGFVTLFFVALVAVNVVGYPVPEPIRVRCCHIWMVYGNADGFVSAPWLGAVRRRLNPFKLMLTVVTTFVYVSSGCITSHLPFLLG